VRHKLDFEGVQEDRWGKGDTVRRAGDYNFSMKWKTKSSIGNGICCIPQKSISSQREQSLL
jgi:hypothetical protein